MPISLSCPHWMQINQDFEFSNKYESFSQGIIIVKAACRRERDLYMTDIPKCQFSSDFNKRRWVVSKKLISYSRGKFIWIRTFLQ